MERKPRFNRGCRLRDDAAAPTVMIPEGLLRLSAGGVRVLRLCDGQKTESEIVAQLQAEHTAEWAERIQSETKDFLARLFARRVLVGSAEVSCGDAGRGSDSTGIAERLGWATGRAERGSERREELVIAAAGRRQAERRRRR